MKRDDASKKEKRDRRETRKRVEKTQRGSDVPLGECHR